MKPPKPSSKKSLISPMEEMELTKSRLHTMGIKARTDVNTRAASSLVDNIKTAHAEYKAGNTAEATKTLKQGPKIKAYIQRNARGGIGGGKQDWDEILMQRSGLYNNN